jgi:hypothetical protein
LAEGSTKKISMRNRNVLTASMFAVGLGAGFIAGCQVYDFEPVTPLIIGQDTTEREIVAKAAKPNIMLLVDKSGSMNLPVNDTGTCTSCGGSTEPLCDETACPTRIRDLREAMVSFLQANGSIARFGVSFYPDDQSCGIAQDDTIDPGVPVSTSADVDSELQTDANAVAARIAAVQAGTLGSSNSTGGGTPTGASIQTVAEDPQLNTTARDDFILLLTDGLPNCNPQHESQVPECTCASGGICPTGSKLACLDLNGTVGKITAAREQRGIRTIVIGFGNDTLGGAPTLNAMAEAGGFTRQCNADADCGAGDVCLDPVDGIRHCQNNKYYQAANATELEAALIAISKILQDPCVFPLNRDPPDNNPDLLVVYIQRNEDPVPRRLTDGTDYEYHPTNGTQGPYVELLGATCETVKNEATAENPVRVEVRVITTL